MEQSGTKRALHEAPALIAWLSKHPCAGALARGTSQRPAHRTSGKPKPELASASPGAAPCLLEEPRRVGSRGELLVRAILARLSEVTLCFEVGVRKLELKQYYNSIVLYYGQIPGRLL